MIKRQYTLYLENKTGILASVTRRLAKAKVNIEGISVAESTHTALVQIVVSNAAKARKAFNEAKISYTSQQVCVVELEHETGALSELSDRLSKARVNINFIYATASDHQDRCCLVISADNLKRVEEIVG